MKLLSMSIGCHDCKLHVNISIKMCINAYVHGKSEKMVLLSFEWQQNKQQQQQKKKCGEKSSAPVTPLFLGENVQLLSNSNIMLCITTLNRVAIILCVFAFVEYFRFLSTGWNCHYYSIQLDSLTLSRMMRYISPHLLSSIGIHSAGIT